MSITSPSALARIQRLAGGDPYREEVLLILGKLEERSDAQGRKIDALDTWSRQHDLNDDRRFAERDADLEAVKKDLAGARSSADDYHDEKQQLIGMRRLVVGSALLISAIYGAIWGIIKFVEWLKTGAAS